MNNRNAGRWEVSVSGVLVALGLAVLLTGCGRRTETPEFPAKEDLIVCTDLEAAVYEPVVKEFEERTGLSVKVLADTTDEIRSRFAQEQSEGSRDGSHGAQPGEKKAGRRPAGKGSVLEPAKQQNWDLAFGVTTELLEAYSELWEPYESTQENMIAEKFRSQDYSWTGFSVLPLVIMYNTNVVTYRELPSGWESLLEPRWQGRVAFADPKVSDISQAALAAAVLASPEGENYPVSLAANLNYKVLDSLTQVNEGILDGRYSVGVTTEEAAQALRSSGADIDYIYPEDGTLVVLEGTAVRAGCGHKETAKQFLDFTAGKEVQKILSVSRSRRSVRTDVAAEKGMDPFDRLPFLDADSKMVSGEKREALAVWEEALRSSAGAGTGNRRPDAGIGEVDSQHDAGASGSGGTS